MRIYEFHIILSLPLRKNLMAVAKHKYYVVWKGASTGVFRSWAECKALVAGFPGARYKAFPTLQAAEAAFKAGPGLPSTAGQGKKKTPEPDRPATKRFDPNGICVDAACSGNPGPMEYQGMLIRDKTLLFHKKFQKGTNNIGEFLAIVHALAYLKQRGASETPIYSDSAIALKWVAAKKCKTQLPEGPETRALLDLIHRAEDWLAGNTFSNPLLKWETDRWGEIPADFGRK
jgi:ribonuclease HI